MSREAEPKPFLNLPDGESLLQKTLARAFAVRADVDVPEVLLVTNRDYVFRTIDERMRLRAEGLPPLRLILEPEGRNTAPAIGLAALAAVEAHGDDALLLVLAADHLINDTAGFRAAVRAAIGPAAEGRLVTFGVVPTRPESGFGYIECGERIADGVHVATRFIEKPPLATARAFVDGGAHLWNSGMFCFGARTLLDALAAHARPVADALDAAWATRRPGAFDGHATLGFDPASFAGIPAISIDYAVMEKAPSVACERAAFDWSDIGSWQAYSETLPADADGNRRTGSTMTIETRNTAVHAHDRLVATIGVENLVVVDTPDALLVAARDQAQAVRDVVAELKRTGDERYRFHRTTARPWGTYTVLNEGAGFKIKRIEVKPGSELSLQLHHRRSEHWVVVSGVAEVTCGERVYPLAANESTFIPVETKHRLANRGSERLVLIEVQCGDYLGEDDIVRFEDKYGRVV
jgi:mannose-1-phosphate guanylyltransferase